MNFVHFVYIYFGLTAFFVFVLLFGDSPIFSGTPVSFSKFLITEGWVIAIEWAVNKAFGNRGLRMLDKATECCCESSNPALQIAYLLLYAFGYGLYWHYIFKLLPNQYAAEYHLYTGTAVVCLTLTLFLKASMSDPGRITAANAATYLAAYPLDGVIFPPKQCSTCQLMRPGRSKHCNACGSCVARFDHHCGWLNACVGLHNMRHFLAFLLANMTVAGYGCWLAGAAVAGQMQRRGFFDVYIYDPQLRDRVPLYHRPAKFAEWVVVYYPIPVALAMFQLVAGYLISEGRTTYESYKRNQLAKDAAALAAAADNTSVQQQQQRGSSSSNRSWLYRLFARGTKKHTATSTAAAAVNAQLAVNYYDKGFVMNWSEVLFPDAFLQQYREQVNAAAAAAANLTAIQQQSSTVNSNKVPAAAGAVEKKHL